MKVEVIGSYGGESPECRLTCLLINDVIALDAGSLTKGLPLERQARIASLVLTHSHIDHTASIPFFIENVFGLEQPTPDLWASAATRYALRRHLFNDATWPDFTRLPNHLLPAVKIHKFDDEVPFEIAGVRFTPIPVNHPVPTHGFIIEDASSSIAWSSDTGPTQRLWEMADEVRNLRAVLVETSFDDSMQEIADVSGHLTPSTLQVELRKLRSNVPIYLHHLKPRCARAIEKGVRDLGLGNVDFLQQGKTYTF